MDDNVINLVKDQFDVSYDLAELTQELKESEPLSSVKMHLQVLVSEIASSENVDHQVRLDAARVLLESSDLFPVYCKLKGGHKILQDVIKEHMRVCLRN